MCQKRPRAERSTAGVCIYVSKETYMCTYVSKDMCQKRPTCAYMCQKRPTTELIETCYMEKETYMNADIPEVCVSVKRDLS